ncbi:MAG: helix-turn-helix domain-containing protein [Clostridia bacterium]|nr:helix-turn-helix domain-containing protein [Clostridia bacterium]
MDRNLLRQISLVSDEERSILSGIPLEKSLYTSNAEFIVNSDKLLGKDRDIMIRTHTRFTSFPLHSHNYLEMMVVLSGGITNRIADKEIRLTEGDILIMNKHVSHSIDEAGIDDVGVNIIISDSFIKSLSGELSETVFTDICNENLKPDGDGIYLCFSTKGNKQIENIIENLLFELSEYGSGSQVLKYTTALLFGYLSRNSEDLLSGGSRMPDKDTKRRSQIQSYISSKYKTATLSELADMLFLSMPYLSKMIVDYFGKSFKELLFERRMSVATSLVLKTKLPIGEIINSVGYENESYFHREFKKVHGMTPLAMRRELGV